MHVYDADRRPLQLEAELARGGEAVVYRVRGRPDVVAKVYTKARAGYDHKLHWMRANPPSDPSRGVGHASIAWPDEVLRDVKGRFVGFTMPYVANAVAVLEVLSPRLRVRVLPGFDRRYLHRTARNLALAVAALHGRDYVVGDLNQSNVLVTPSALVTLIDTDSFQVQERRPSQIVFYPCPVGKPEYTPPELQGQAYGGRIRLPEHDLFGLAVLIFQLLMEGSHPFRSAWQGAGDPPPLEEKIARGLYPYQRPLPSEVLPPPGSAGMEGLYPGLAELFGLALAAGHANPRRRPLAETWAQVLAEAEQALVTCRQGHLHADHLPRCPQCGVRHQRAVRRTVARAASSAASAPVPAAVAGGTAGTVVVRRPSPLVAVVATVTWPARVVGHAVEEAMTSTARSAKSGLRWLGVFAVQRVAANLGLPATQPVAMMGGRRRRVLRRTTGLALVAGLLALGAGLLSAVLWTTAGAGAAMTPATSPLPVAGVAGGLALALGGLFRGLGDRLDGGLTAAEVGSAVLRAAALAGGWAAAWFAAGLVWRLVPGMEDPVLNLGPAGAAGAVERAAWLIGWLLYGAVGGAVGAPSVAPAGRWLFVGGVFGVVGCLAAWLAALAMG